MELLADCKRRARPLILEAAKKYPGEVIPDSDLTAIALQISQEIGGSIAPEDVIDVAVRNGKANRVSRTLAAPEIYSSSYGWTKPKERQEGIARAELLEQRKLAIALAAFVQRVSRIASNAYDGQIPQDELTKILRKERPKGISRRDAEQALRAKGLVKGTIREVKMRAIPKPERLPATTPAPFAVRDPEHRRINDRELEQILAAVKKYYEKELPELLKSLAAPPFLVMVHLLTTEGGLNAEEIAEVLKVPRDDAKYWQEWCQRYLKDRRPSLIEHAEKIMQICAVASL